MSQKPLPNAFERSRKTDQSRSEPSQLLPREIRQLVLDKYAGVAPAAKLAEDKKRLIQGEPLAYVIGWQPFAGLCIDLSKRPLIPRLETEWWVTKVLQELKNETKPRQILDLFAGSGCIGLAAAAQFTDASVYFGDVERGFLHQIQLNWQLNHLTNSFQIIETDIFSEIDGQYDLIFANPPYCPPKRWERLDTSVTHWEPRQAIVSPQGSLYFLKRLLDEIDGYLTPAGRLYCEFDSRSFISLRSWCKTHHPAVKFYRDQSNRWRYLMASKEEV